MFISMAMQALRTIKNKQINGYLSNWLVAMLTQLENETFGYESVTFLLLRYSLRVVMTSVYWKLGGIVHVVSLL